jgi:hypothetical protein
MYRLVRGIKKTHMPIKKKYSFPNMRHEIEGYVKRRKRYQINKILRPRRKVPFEITITAHKPFKKCSLDIEGPLTDTQKGNKYILT